MCEWNNHLLANRNISNIYCNTPQIVFHLVSIKTKKANVYHIFIAESKLHSSFRKREIISHFKDSFCIYQILYDNIIEAHCIDL